MPKVAILQHEGRTWILQLKVSKYLKENIILKVNDLDFHARTLKNNVDEQNYCYCLNKIFQNYAGNSIIFDPKSTQFGAAKSPCLKILSAPLISGQWPSNCIKTPSRAHSRLRDELIQTGFI